MAGYLTPSWANDNAPAIDATALTEIGQGIELAEHPYGVCSTASATAAKTVTIDYSGTLTLFAGLSIRVKFTNQNAAQSATLDVNGTGSVSIMINGINTAGAGAWGAGDVVSLTYDGTYWIMNGVTTSAVDAAINRQGTLYNTPVKIPAGTSATIVLTGDYTKFRFLTLMLSDNNIYARRCSTMIPTQFANYNTWFPFSYEEGGTLHQGAVKVMRVQIPNTNPAQYYTDRLSVTQTMTDGYINVILGLA